jgi:ribosomal protein S18 acetylase RimI-like enzyme
MIRPTTSEDVPVLLNLAQNTGVFKPVELVAFKEVLQGYLEKPRGEGYHCYTCEREGQVVGFTCHGPNTMTDGTWDLYWIAVAKNLQAKGIGSQLLAFVENDIRRQKGRLIMIETSSLPSYEPTRRFYLKHAYERVATVPDFYADGDSLIMFQKRLSP